MAEGEVTRRLAAIVAADVAGYSRLTEADEEGTLAALRAHRRELIDPKITDYRGRIANTAGDSILAEFPSVIEALRCASDIQQGMTERNTSVPEQQRLAFRIGINIGDVVDHDGDLLGDGVNVAARLEGLAEPGGICLSRAARDQVRDRLDISLEDMGEVEVKNIIRPVRAFRVLQDGEAVTRSTGFMPGKLGLGLGAVLLSAVFAGGGLWWWQPWVERVDAARPDRFAHKLPDKPSIAILPFENLSGDPQQDYFADGFTEDVITNVAQSKELFVIARNSTFSYKGRTPKIRQVAEELGVRYVLEGSVRRIGEMMRITAQLIDATSGTQVWAKRYDEPIDKVFDVQDELSREIAGTLVTNIRAADLAKASQKRPKDLSAYDYVLQARARYDVPNKDGKMEARALAEQAIAIDPNYAPAYAILGNTFNSAYIIQWEGPEALDRAFEAARKAVELDPLSSAAHEVLGRVLLRREQHAAAVDAIERAIALNPNRADHYASLADVLTFANRPGEAIDLLKKAMRLDPFYPPRHNMYLGRAYYFSKQYEKAVTELKTCAARAPKYRPCYMFLAPTYVELSRQEDARRTVATLLKIAPKFSIRKSVQNHLPFVPAAMQFYIDGLRKAGLPENPPLVLPDKPSIAVLPFTNMSDDKEQDYFADGITEDITTDLSKVAGLLVTSRAATLRYRGAAINHPQISNALRVRYLLQGSVRRAEGRVRLTAQLVDATTGTQVWAERYDRDLDDVFAIQDDVAARVVAALSVILKEGTLRRAVRKYTPKIEAYDLYIRGRAKRIPPTPDNLATALALFEKAIAIDPKFSGGYAGAAYVHVLRYGDSTVPPSSRDDYLETALRLATQAVELDPTFGPGWGSLAEARYRKREFDQALTAIQRAMAEAPSDSLMRAMYGRLLGYAGRPEDGIEQVNLAMRMSPDSLPLLFFLGANYRAAGRFEKAIEALIEHRQRLGGRVLPAPTLQLAAAYMQAERGQEARATVDVLLKKSPHLDLEWAVRIHAYKDRRDEARFLEALRKAGLPPPKTTR